MSPETKKRNGLRRLTFAESVDFLAFVAYRSYYRNCKYFHTCFLPLLHFVQKLLKFSQSVAWYSIHHRRTLLFLLNFSRPFQNTDGKSSVQRGGFLLFCQLEVSEFRISLCGKKTFLNLKNFCHQILVNSSYKATETVKLQKYARIRLFLGQKGGLSLKRL